MKGKRKKASRRRSSVRGLGKTPKSLGGILETAAPILGGMVAGEFTEKLPYLNENPNYVAPANVGLGIAAMMFGKGFIASAGLGLFLNGGGKLVSGLINKDAGANGLPYKLRSSSDYANNGQSAFRMG